MTRASRRHVQRRKTRFGIICQFSAEIVAVRFRNTTFSLVDVVSLPKKKGPLRLHEEAKDFRLWCSGGVYEPADADI